MNVHDHKQQSAAWKNQAAGFHAILLQTYVGRQVLHSARAWGSMQWATPVTSGDAADDQDALMGIAVTWGSPPPAPTSLTPAAGALLAYFDLVSAAEGIGPMFNNTSNALGARQDTPIPIGGTRTLVTPDGLDVAVYAFVQCTLTFGLGTYRGMSASVEAQWSTVDW